jgi:DNA-binding response OmpR family regulator
VTKDKILFVEDDPEQANVLKLYFESQGYQVMQASWGRARPGRLRGLPADSSQLANEPDTGHLPD